MIMRVETSSGQRGASGGNASELPPDALDGALYESARARFERELAQHGINEAACPVRGPELALGCNVVLRPRTTIRLYM